MDAIITDMATPFTSRSEVRDEIESSLDKAQPKEEQARTWGVEITADDWERLKAASKLGG